MADILIRDLEIPKDGRITIQIGADGAVYFVEECTILAEKYEKSAHAVLLPEGHGKLGDLDALMNELQNLFDKREKDARFSGDRTVSVTWNDAIHHIISAPTIIPAEGGNADGN